MVVTRHELKKGRVFAIRNLKKRLTSSNVRNFLKLLVNARYCLAVFVKIHVGDAQVSAESALIIGLAQQGASVLRHRKPTCGRPHRDRQDGPCFLAVPLDV